MHSSFVNISSQGDLFSFSNLDSLPLGRLVWNENAQLVSPPESGSPTVTSATQLPVGLRRDSRCALLLSSLSPSLADSGATATATATAITDETEAGTTRTNMTTTDRCPDLSAPLEERFAYVLRCARGAGFGSFDALALQYYARDFAPASDLALEQRLSRRRHLPGLLAELRARAGAPSSSSWSDWQRRGYQEEMLRAAEEICAGECLELRQRMAVGVGVGVGYNSNGGVVDDSEEDVLSVVLQPDELCLEEIVSTATKPLARYHLYCTPWWEMPCARHYFADGHFAYIFSSYPISGPF
ncbi:hypothetical protein PG988_015488 [Apiospora saccharicola]